MDEHMLTLVPDPPAYPYFDLYSSSVPATAENKASTVTLHAAYPSFDLCENLQYGLSDRS